MGLNRQTMDVYANRNPITGAITARPTTSPISTIWFRDIVINVQVGVGAAGFLKVKKSDKFPSGSPLGSKADPKQAYTDADYTLDFTAPSSRTNWPWSYVQMVDNDTGTPYDGTVGIDLSTISGSKSFEINTDVCNFIGLEATGDCDVFVSMNDNS